MKKPPAGAGAFCPSPMLDIADVLHSSMSEMPVDMEDGLKVDGNEKRGGSGRRL